eukprot:34355-Pyramimonas_sp.AAC.1
MRKELPRGLLRKRVNRPAIKAAGPMPDVAFLNQDDAKSVLLESVYVLDDGARAKLQEGSEGQEQEKPKIQHAERYDLNQFRTDKFSG